jgi:O-antigen/teichoic acid export membrane protein
VIFHRGTDIRIEEQINTLKRDASYVFWMFAEVAATLVIPRLVLFPLAAYFIGKEQFGVFMTAMSLALILGTQPGNGLAIGLLKHLSDYPQQQAAQFCGTALRLCHWAMSAVVSLGLIIIIIAGITKLAPMEILSCLAPRIISLYPENQFMLILTESRVHRRFRGRAIWSLLRSVGVLICGFVGVLAGGAIGLAWGFLVGNVIAYAILQFHYGDWSKNSYNAEMARILKTIWFQMTVAGIMAVSGPYLIRVILSAIHSYNDTADLVAATSVMFLFSVPITCLGGLLLSMISKYNSVEQFSVRGKILFLLVTLFSITVMPVAFKLFGPFTVRIMFPKFGEDSVGLVGILLWAIPAQTLICFSQPVVVKFAPIRLVPIINMVSMAATLLPAICLIPGYATRGAAWAIVAGQIVTGFLWAFFCITVFYKQASNAHAVPVEQTSCCGSELGGT